MAGEAGSKFRVYISTTSGTGTTYLKDANKYFTDIDFPDEGANIDVTGIGDSNKTYDSDLGDISLRIRGNDYSSVPAGTGYAESGPYDLLGGDAKRENRYVEVAIDGTTTAGKRRAVGTFTVMSYNLTAAVGGKRGFESRLVPIGDVTFGVY
jgi:hypothetical protein